MLTIQQGYEIHDKVAEDVLKERLRQIKGEGWTFEHDDQYKNDKLVRAAICYAKPQFPYPLDGEKAPIGWPWEEHWWKPNESHRRNLVKAAALLIAEIERLDRQEVK